MPTLEWLLDRLPVLIFVIIAVVQIARALMKSREAQSEHEETFDETEEQRRIREIQERLRRTIAERRGQMSAPAAPPPRTDPPVLRTPVEAEEEDPFHRRMPEPPITVAVAPRETISRELERQAELAQRMRELAEAKELARRRAATSLGLESSSQAEAAALAGQRHRLIGSLRDPESLRRAFVLREVLGPPVGLR